MGLEAVAVTLRPLAGRGGLLSPGEQQSAEKETETGHGVNGPLPGHLSAAMVVEGTFPP